MDTFTGNDGQLRELALFAGAGGGILGGHLLGWRTVCAVEIEPYAAGVLVARQNDGILPPFPIWDDVCTFDGRPWRGRVDVISGGFPCQDISIAGKGKGLEGERSGLWREMARIIGEVRPRYVLVENSPMLTVRGGARVIGDLAEMGYDCRWGIVSAADAGAPHKRERIWIYATDASQGGCDCRGCDKPRRHLLHNGNGNAEESDAARSGWERGVGEACENVADADQIMRNGSRNARDGRAEFTDGSKTVADTDSERFQRIGEERNSEGSAGLCDREGRDKEPSMADTENKGNVRRNRKLESAQREMRELGRSAEDGSGEWWETEPNVGRVVDELAARVDRLKAIGNGQVPAVVRLAWETLRGGMI